MRTATVVLALVVVLVAAPAWADFKAGKEAYLRGDYATALKEWRPLAEQGDALAQSLLGVMYAEGLGVPQDFVQAHMWFNLAGAGGYEPAPELRAIMAKHLTPAQIDDAQRLAREWKPKGK